MTLPRWTVYPALVVIAALVIMAVPRRASLDPYASEAAAGARPLVVLGIDGMDPDVLREVVERYPERMSNFRWLIEQADGIRELGTSTPPQSPVAWSNFITGLDPGGHGIFDFIHRDPTTRQATTSTTVTEKGFTLHLPGPYKLDIGADSPSNRSGESFWSILQRHGVPADIWRIPANFPVEPSEGFSFSGMMTPALDSAYGECTFYTSDPMRDVQLDYEKTVLVREYEGRIDASIQGPPNPFKEGDPHEQLAFRVYVDRQAGAVAIYAGEDGAETEKVVLRPGEWSGFVRLDFELLPMGLMSMSGICRFYLRSIEPEIELYASAVNLDPEAPAAPVSEPEDASTEVTQAIGRYYTQGMAEDVNALKRGVLTDPEFMQQVELVYRESVDMLDYALERYVERGKRGLLFFYFSTIDLGCHMMWRHHDGEHPAHDPELAAQDSSAWSRREGSTWNDAVHDLYLRMDPPLGRIREELGDDITLIVMSDHGFAPFRREFSLNTWLVEHGYLVLQPGKTKELPRDTPGFTPVAIYDGSVDWTRTRAYGMGFNGLYLNLAGRELDDPKTEADESGIVRPEEAQALLRELKQALEAEVDPDTGAHPILRCDLASEVYRGERVPEAPDLLIGYDAGYGNSDNASVGRIPNAVLMDNSLANHGGKLGTFNGSHLMAPDVVAGLFLSNRPARPGPLRLEDLTVEVLHHYGIDKPQAMKGAPVLVRP
jgi:predicted AlkP superfamily phosphohydrolase/phosphomutase